ncbi:MAG: glycogen debranching protein GlgX [Methylococcales bacterium]|jgi:isoamylase|nr:glycogen debranching protein GlgX [Methylococcales bacterium]MBT7443628.1 glycogen debranching protein GlgX [Methylococcales bacterium]
MLINRWTLREGAPKPLGATWLEAQQQFNFALFSKHATGVTLVLFSKSSPATPIASFTLDHLLNKTGSVWHIMVPLKAMKSADYYAYQVDGPFEPEQGHRFDPEKYLLDPYAKGVYFPPEFSREKHKERGSNAGFAALGVVPVAHNYDWSGDVEPERHTHDLIIYEMHVAGFTKDASSKVKKKHRGTFAGVVEKIPHLKALGVTAVELLPVHQFDPEEANYWGYMTLNFFTPNLSYTSGEPGNQQLDEFRDMVKALHQAGIEVILDVVYNHTTEDNEAGPTFSYRGIDNKSYYILLEDERLYCNDAGTGNVLQCADPNVRTMVIDSMRFWVEEMHVDGFRFDLASILTRNRDGSVNSDDPALISIISNMKPFANTRLIAEAWDIAAYQLGQSFPGTMWYQWNGKFRDDIREFIKGSGTVSGLMTRLYGSADLFPDDLEAAYHAFQSVNFITAHDGFTMRDLVSYNHKHNAANGHAGTDGTDDNCSWNCGIEGDEEATPKVWALRHQQIKNMACLLMISNGTPMIVAGDEFMNTQGGNNNPYNQDNEITWLNWQDLTDNKDIFSFFQGMIAFRKAHPSLGRSRYWREDVMWYGPTGPVDFSEDSKTLAFLLKGESEGDTDLFVMINAFWEPIDFILPEGKASDWLEAVNTAEKSGQDCCAPGTEKSLKRLSKRVEPRSIVVCIRK